MKNSFAELANGTNRMTRKFGGTQFGVADPYLTGYHFIYFTNIPKEITHYTSEMNSKISSDDEISKILSSSCLSVTPPGGTLNTVEFTGLGGIKWNVPGNIDYGTTISLKFLEMNKTPILDIMHGWVKMMRDYRTGVSYQIDGSEGAGYSNKTYAAVLWYWTTAPDGVSLEYAACYDGVFPKKDPQDLFASDVETVGRLDIEIEFNVDYAWHEPWVYDKCEGFANTFSTAIPKIEGYHY